MRVLRCGSDRFRGWVTVVNESSARDKVKVRENGKGKEIVLGRKGQPAESGNCHHDFEVILTLQDFGRAIEEVAEAIEDSPVELRDAMKPYRDSLMKLTLCASGYASRKI
jgi:hypothetical protein